MVPPAPLTFSMITDWPSASRSRSASILGSTSVAPPGANGTTMVIGCEGKGWEAAGLAAQRLNLMTAIRIARRLCTTSSSLELHAGGLHDLAPFGPLGPGVLREVVGRGGHGFGSHRLQ